MSKMIVDETEWSQREHQLKMYRIWKRAIDWMNATHELMNERCNINGDEQSKGYHAAHTLNYRATEFFSLLTGNIGTSVVVGFADTDKYIENQYRAVVKELLA